MTKRMCDKLINILEVVQGSSMSTSDKVFFNKFNIPEMDPRKARWTKENVTILAHYLNLQ